MYNILKNYINKVIFKKDVECTYTIRSNIINLEVQLNLCTSLCTNQSKTISHRKFDVAGQQAKKKMTFTKMALCLK